MSRNFTQHATKNFQRWKKSEDDKLKSLIRGGCNSEEIALELGRTRASVMGRKSFLGIREKMTPARGSSMPYTSFARNRSLDEKKKVHTSSVAYDAPLGTVSIGSSIDTVIARAKSMGLKVNITISSEK